MPNLPLIERFQAAGWEVHYIGSGQSFECTLVGATGAIYHAINTGKLRRYFTLVNVVDALRVVIGILQACWLLVKIRPKIIFSKGGYVSFPVVVGGWLNRIPVVAHESDLSPGLANLLSYPFVKKICTTFADTGAKLPSAKVVQTGTPIRPEIFTGVAKKGLAYCQFSSHLPVLLVIGGSQGARQINQAIRDSMPGLLEKFQVVHICGVGNLSSEHNGLTGFRQFEFLQEELPDVLAAADLVVSRAGSNSLVELLALRLPHLLIPLSKVASRGDQLENAAMTERNGWSMVLQEHDLNADSLMAALAQLLNELASRRKALMSFNDFNAVNAVEALLLKYAR